jgi:hypothetical protein
MDFDIPFVDLPPAEPETLRETVQRMTTVLATGTVPERRAPNLAAAFDAGVANLVLEDAPLNIKNPVATGSKSRKGSGRARPAGAEDFQDLFATGLILLLAFTVGEWAQPTKEEALGIAAPLGNILARRIDLAAKLGRDASDAMALTIALLTYLSRVGPIAAERVREQYTTRQHRERVLRDRGPAERPADRGAGGVASGQGNGTGPDYGATPDPFALVAEATNLGRDILGRDLGPDTGRAPAVGDR